MLNNYYNIPKSVDEAADRPFRPKTGGGKRQRQEHSDRKLFNEINRLCGHKSGSFSGKSSVFGKGRGGLESRNYMQRVVVKSRVVKIKGNGKELINKHINYITRSGVEKDGSPAIAFNENIDLSKEDLNKFVDKCQHDRHTFRLIISPEDAEYLNLKTYTREVVDRMERDMNTRLQWVAVNHHNTDNPHTHLFIRGVNDKGNDLYIKRDYISNGIRVRCQEISTSYLGHRTELDIEEQIENNIRKERLTDLDRNMLRNSRDYVVDLSATPENYQARFRRNAMLQRCAYLSKLGLASETEPGKWQLHPEAEKILKELGQRGDIIKTMHASLRGENTMPECVIYSKFNDDQQLKGVVIGKGLSDELSGDTYMIVKATDNKAYYIPLSNKSEKEGQEAETGSLVSVSGKGHYITVHTHSRLSIADQITAEGPTYLDREIAKKGIGGPADKVLSAMENDLEKAKAERFKVLQGRGLTNTPEAGKPALKYDAFDKLEQAEHDKIYRIFKEKGYAKAEIPEGKEFTGHIVKIDKLSDGAYAVMANTSTKEVAVVPYRNGMERAMDNNREVRIEVQRKRAGFEPAHISVKSIERSQSKEKDKGWER